MTGVTTVLKSGSDKSGLIQWASNLGTAKAFQNALTMSPDKLKELVAEIEKFPKIDTKAAQSLDKPFPEFKSARVAHISKRDGAADLGTQAHKICEEFELGILDESKHAPEAIQRARPYLEWYTANVAKTLFVEMPLFSRSMFIGGTPDGGFQLKDGKNLINDKKFKGGIFGPDPYWQMAAYRAMLEEMWEDTETPIRIELDNEVKEFDNPRQYLQSFGETKWDGSMIALIDEKKEMKPMFRYSYEQDLKAFLACLTLYRETEAFKIPWQKK